MKWQYLLLLFFSTFILAQIKAQKIYTLTSGELIFSFSDVQLSNDFKSQYGNAEITKTNVRFTLFFHIGEYLHMDFNNKIGIFTGLGIRNVGLSSDEKLPDLVGSDQTLDYKIIKRLYTIGLPLAIKLGSFKDHFYFFAGGECESALQYKEKYWTNTQTRSGSMTKSTQWFGNQTPHFLPSVFAGVQMPHGFNIRFKYYLIDFLNNEYKSGNNDASGAVYNVSDLTRYAKSQVFYFSICWQFRNKGLIEYKQPANTQVAYSKQ
jgi:hypothetical protein